MLNIPILRRLFGAALWLLLLGSAAAQVDPPGRVARINQFDGAVSFAPGGTEDWAYAQLNRPLTTGDRLWVDPGGRAELHVGAAALRVNEQTSLGFVELDDDTATVKVTQGTVSLRVRSLPRDQHYEIQTPNLAFVPNAPGEYRIDVAPDGSTTNIAIREGSGVAYGENGAGVAVPGRQQLRFAGRRLTPAGASNSLPGDAFENWVHSRDRAEDASISARYVPREVIGYQQLDDNGTWRETAEYGPVWTPNVVAAGWAPYRTGHWAWIPPWGWTWIDDAPWGFAPYHYGRWAYLGNRWSWVPGRHIYAAPPVYAPALVVFVGGRGTSLTLSFGSTHSSGVAWFPLAPGEVYRPAYTASPRYISNVNRTTVVNNTTINNVIVNNTTINKTVYVNQKAPNAITAVPSTTFVRGQAVAPVAKALPRQQLAGAQILATAPGVAPVKQSFLGDAKPVRRPVAASLPAIAPVAVSPAARKELHTGLAPAPVAAVAGKPAVNPAMAPAGASRMAAPVPGQAAVVDQAGTQRPPAVAPARADRVPSPQERLGMPAANAARTDVPAPAPSAQQRDRPQPPAAEGKRSFEGIRRLDPQAPPTHAAPPPVLRNESPRPLLPATLPRTESAPVQARATDASPARREAERRLTEVAKPVAAVQAPHPQTPSPVLRSESVRPPAFRPNSPAPERETGAVSFSGKGRDQPHHAPGNNAAAVPPGAVAAAPSKRPSLPEVIVKRPEVQVARVPAGAPAVRGGHAGEGRPPGRNDGAAPHRNDKPAEVPKRREEPTKPDSKPDAAR